MQPVELPILKLKPGREKSLLRRHPWIFSGAVAAVEGELAPGETVRVVNARGQFLGLGAYSPASQIRVRVWSWAQEPCSRAVVLRIAPMKTGVVSFPPSQQMGRKKRGLTPDCQGTGAARCFQNQRK